MIMTIDLQHKIYELLKVYVLPKLRYDNDLMNVLSSIWDVYQRKATGEDYRYKVLGDEIEKHFIMNDDWAEDKLFVGILNLFDDETKFIQFTEQLTNIFRTDEGFEAYLKELTGLLEDEHLALYEERNEQGRVTYKIGEQENRPQLLEGVLKFYVCESNVYNVVNFYENDVKWPEDKNCYVLTHDYGWNDYSYYTRYRLYYVKDGNISEIGQVKIMKRGTDDTSDCLPKEFVALGDDYCSLGYTTSYYSAMRNVLGGEAPTVLNQLRDVAFYESIYKQFEDDNILKTSLLRTNESEKARREGRYYLYGRNMDDAYAFSYNYRLPYPGEDVEINFNYKYNGENYERIIGMIGENGVGKTTLIKQILHSLIANDNTQFTGLRPLFSSVLMISYSPFDHYQVDTQGKEPFINYEYSGLMKGEEQMFTTREQVEILAENIKSIYHRQYRYASSWEALVNKVIPIDQLNRLITEGDDNEVDVDVEGLNDLCEKASSGETMYLYSISAIMAKIRSDSLIIMDEPEQHLHPRAVTALMHSLYRILERYDSYALISTHSPYVIRELVSPNVMLFKRFGNELNVKRIGIESFGEDVSVLSDMVFDNLRDEKRYEKFIEEIVEKNQFDYDSSVRELQTGPNELSLNAKLLVRTYIEKKRDEAPET